MKVIREIIWRKHETIQSTQKEWVKWYEGMEDLIIELDEKRQEIVKKYFQMEDGELKLNAQGAYVPKKGVDLANYDREMAALMSVEEEIESI